MLNFAANLNFLFTEGAPSLVEKFRLAQRAGFKAVEIAFPQNNDSISDVINVKQETDMSVALINIALDSNHKFGLASIPGQEETFRKYLQQTIDLAKAVNCKKIHLIAGLLDSNCSPQLYEEHLKTYRNNLKYAASQLESSNIVGLIEPINKYAVPGYFMNSYDTAISLLKELNSKHLRLLVDVFHLQHIRGNVTNTIAELKDLIGHFQIAQAPHRHEPDVAGELNYDYVFSLISQSGYADWIGCEYKPKTNTLEGLKWLDKYNKTSK